MELVKQSKKKYKGIDFPIHIEPIPLDRLAEYRRNAHADYTYRDYSPITVPRLYPEPLKTEPIEYPLYTSQDTQLIGYETDFDIDAVRNSLLNIFLVQKNEVPGKPEFGNPLGLEVFDIADRFVIDRIEANIKSEVAKYDRRINILKVDVESFPLQNRIIVNIVYEVFIFDNKIKDSIYLPFSHNDHTYLGGRSASIL